MDFEEKIMNFEEKAIKAHQDRKKIEEEYHQKLRQTMIKNVRLSFSSIFRGEEASNVIIDGDIISDLNHVSIFVEVEDFVLRMIFPSTEMKKLMESSNREINSAVYCSGVKVETYRGEDFNDPNDELINSFSDLGEWIENHKKLMPKPEIIDDKTYNLIKRISEGRDIRLEGSDDEK